MELNPTEFKKSYISRLIELLKGLEKQDVESVISSFEGARESGRKILFIGNGGSAATASHFANDLGYGTRTWQKPFRALALTDNVAVLTAIANDYAYDEVFTKQLQVIMRPGDVLVAISASGNSPNVVKAVEYAKSCGNETIGLVGFDGGKLAALCAKKILVETKKGEYGPVEDVHMVIDHLIGAYLMQKIRSTQ